MSEDPKTDLDINGKGNNVVKDIADSTVTIDQSTKIYNFAVLTAVVEGSGPKTDVQITRLEGRLTLERREMAGLDQELTALRARKSELDDSVETFTKGLNDASEELSVVQKKIVLKEKDLYAKSLIIKTLEDVQ